MVGGGEKVKARKNGKIGKSRLEKNRERKGALKIGRGK